MDLRLTEEFNKSLDVGFSKKKETPVRDINTSSVGAQSNGEVDSAGSLQHFLDHIPVSSIPGIRHSPVLEVKKEDTVGEAIHALYEKNAFVALIADAGTGNFPDRYIGVVEFPSLVLWCLEELENERSNEEDAEVEEADNSGILGVLQKNPHIGQTQISALAKSFLWDPFFPVRPEDSLFHVLLLLSTHRLQAVPVIDQSSSRVIGFITQNAVIHLLLRSRGLEWFDGIADKVLSQFRFENEEHVVQVYRGQTVAEALKILWENRSGAVAIVDRETHSLMGCIRRTDTYLLLKIGKLFQNRKKLTAEEFIYMESTERDSVTVSERDLADTLSLGALQLRNNIIPKMDSPVTNRSSDTLKQAMETMVEKRSNFSFLVNNSMQARGVLALRDVIIQFAPPSMDSRIRGCGFFESALEETGCHVENGTIVRNRGPS